MKLYSISLIVFILTISSNHLMAQSDCNNFHTQFCDGYGDPYKYSGQSKSATMELGETSGFKMTTYGGFEYCVSLCADKQLKGAYFKIKDNNSGEVLYDGQAEGDEMAQKQFFIEDSKQLIIEVNIPASPEPKENLTYDELVGCVGVIIEYNKTGKKGFN